MKTPVIKDGYYYIRLKRDIRHTRSGKNNWALSGGVVVIAAIKPLTDGDVKAVVSNPGNPTGSAKISLWNYQGKEQQADFEIVAFIPPVVADEVIKPETPAGKSIADKPCGMPDTQWAMHVRGSDDMHEATSFENACQQVTEFNQWVIANARNRTVNDPVLWAVLVQIPMVEEVKS